MTNMEHDSLYAFLSDPLTMPDDPEVRLKIAAAMPLLLGRLSRGVSPEDLAEIVKKEAPQLGCDTLELAYAFKLSAIEFNQGVNAKEPEADQPSPSTLDTPDREPPH